MVRNVPVGTSGPDAFEQRVAAARWSAGTAREDKRYAVCRKRGIANAKACVRVLVRVRVRAFVFVVKKCINGPCRRSNPGPLAP